MSVHPICHPSVSSLLNQPDEILVHIFTLLDVDALAELSLVCKKIYAITQDAIFQKKLLTAVIDKYSQEMATIERAYNGYVTDGLIASPTTSCSPHENSYLYYTGAPGKVCLKKDGQLIVVDGQSNQKYDGTSLKIGQVHVYGVKQLFANQVLKGWDTYDALKERHCNKPLETAQKAHQSENKRLLQEKKRLESQQEILKKKYQEKKAQLEKLSSKPHA